MDHTAPPSPRTSIITPLYNGSSYLPGCIASVRAQTDGDFEHIIIDNGSTDDGPKIAAEAAKRDPRIRILTNDVPGPGPTRNVGIEHARGRYIAFLDCDDAWRPEKLERQISKMSAENLALCWTSYAVRTPNWEQIRIQDAKSHVDLPSLLAKKAVIGCLTSVYDREQLGKRFMTDQPTHEDFCLWIDILKDVESSGLRAGGLTEVLADYRTGGKTANKVKAASLQWHAYRKHAGLGVLASASLFASYAFHGVRQRLARGKPEMTA